MSYFLKYTMLFFVCSTTIFCSEIQKTPIPFYNVPHDILPIIEPTVRHRINSAAEELHQEGILQTNGDSLTHTAEVLTPQITRQRILGVSMIVAGAGTIVLTGGSPYRITHPEIIPTCAGILAAGTVVFCDSMFQCCCWRHRIKSTKKLIIKHHEKVE